MKKVYILLLAAIVLVACKERTSVSEYQVLSPVVTAFRPHEGEVGTEITIEGENLTRVDSVWIGETVVKIAYRISQRELVAEVVSGAKSGPITVSNTAGSYTTGESFQVSYSQPHIDRYPTEATVYDQVVLSGQNLHFIQEVKIDGQAVTIVAQRNNELVFEVPFRDEEEPVTLRFTYFDGEKTCEFGPEGATFVVVKQKPEITQCPTSLTKYQPVRMEGVRLQLIDALYIGDLKAEIRLQNENTIEFDVPSNYFDGPFTAPLRAFYYETKELIIVENFEVISDPNEPRYTAYKGVTLSARSASGGTEEAFFDADQGLVISSCDAQDQMMAIDFFLYDNTGYAQLYSPSNATNTLKNYKCDGTSITAADPNAWSEFYKTECLFRVLDPSKELHKAVIDAYEQGTIIKLDDAFFEGIDLPTGKAPRVYESDEDRDAAGSSHFSCHSYAWGWVRNNTTGKNGIIKITGVKASADTGKTYEATFDMIWEK